MDSRWISIIRFSQRGSSEENRSSTQNCVPFLCERVMKENHPLHHLKPNENPETNENPRHITKYAGNAIRMQPHTRNYKEKFSYPSHAFHAVDRNYTMRCCVVCMQFQIRHLLDTTHLVFVENRCCI